jgi:hypothetical protein
MNVPQFTAEASLGRPNARYSLSTASSSSDGGVAPALIGHWPIPWTRCSINCLEACVRFCGPTGWDCCGWETRCALVCDGEALLNVGWPL